MKFSKRRWSLGEKSLFLAPLLITLGAGALKFAPQVARHVLGTPQLLETSPKNFLLYMRLSADGNVLAATGYIPAFNDASNCTLYLWDARTLEPIAPIAPSQSVNFSNGKRYQFASRFDGIALSPDGRKISFSSTDASLAVLDLKTRQKLWKNNHLGRLGTVSQADFSHDGKHLAVSNSAEVAILDATTGKETTSWNRIPENSDTQVLWLPQSQLLASISDIKGRTNNRAGHGGKIEIHDLQGKKVRELESDFTTAFNFSPDGKRLVCAGNFFDSKRSPFFSNPSSNVNFVRCFDLASGALQWERLSDGSIQKTAQYRDALFSPDGKTVAVHAISAHQVLLLNAKSGREIRHLPIHFDDDSPATLPKSLAFSPDGKRLFVRGNHSVLVWDLK